MKEKKGISKWLYWFSLGVAIIIVYNCISNFSGLYDFLGKIFKVIMPFFMAIIIAYLFYRPVRSVSYTHLDVYKRQSQKLMMKK